LSFRQNPTQWRGQHDDRYCCLRGKRKWKSGWPGWFGEGRWRKPLPELRLAAWAVPAAVTAAGAA
jgi:hypothetical protein